MSQRVIPISRRFVRTCHERKQVFVSVSPKLDAFCQTLRLYLCHPGIWNLNEIA